MASNEEMSYQLILASQSPRRKELLSYLGMPFEIIPSGVEENSDKKDIGEWVMDLANQKANDVFNQIKNNYSNPIIIGADTIVYFKGKTLGKPKSRVEAKSMLESLMGNKHEVYTGVSIISKNSNRSFFEMSSVYFSNISDELLEFYLDSNEYADKAGSYGIQGAALPFIERVEGCYSNIVGFPLARFRKEFSLFNQSNVKV